MGGKSLPGSVNINDDWILFEYYLFHHITYTSALLLNRTCWLHTTVTLSCCLTSISLFCFKLKQLPLP